MCSPTPLPSLHCPSRQVFGWAADLYAFGRFRINHGLILDLHAGSTADHGSLLLLAAAYFLLVFACFTSFVYKLIGETPAGDAKAPRPCADTHTHTHARARARAHTHTHRGGTCRTTWSGRISRQKSTT